MPVRRKQAPHQRRRWAFLRLGAHFRSILARILTKAPKPASAPSPPPQRGKTDAIVPHAPSIIKLFYTVEALKPESKSIVLQFVSALPDEGASTIAKAFAAVAASAGGKSILFVDCTPLPGSADQHGHPATLIDAFKQNIERTQIITRSAIYPNLQTARLSDHPNPIIEIDGGQMARLFGDLRAEFPLIILDAGAATEMPDAMALSRYCDGSILVVRAGYSSPATIMTVKKNIELLGGEIIGVVMNRHKSYLPGWLERWLYPDGAED